MIEFANYENYEKLLSEGFVIVDFYSETCGPCKILARILEEITYELPFVNIVKVNCTAYPKLGTDNDIEAVPTVFFVKDGKLLERVVGLMDQDELTEKISEYYYG